MKKLIIFVCLIGVLFSKSIVKEISFDPFINSKKTNYSLSDISNYPVGIFKVDKKFLEYNVSFKGNKLVLTSITGKQSWELDKKSLVYRDKEWGEEKDEVIRYWKRIN